MKSANFIGKKGARLKILLGLLLAVIMTFGMTLTASSANPTTYTCSMTAYYQAGSSAPADGYTQVGIIFKNNEGWGGHPVTFTSSPYTLQLPSGQETGFGGQVTEFYITSTVPGPVTIYGNFWDLNGQKVVATANCTVNFTKLPNPDTVSVTAYNITHTPNGTSNIIATVTCSGTGRSNIPVTFTTDGGNLRHQGTLTPTTTQYTDSNGQAYATLTMPVQDTARVTATVSADYGSASGYCVVTFSDGSGSDPNPGTYYKVYYNGNGNTAGSVPIDGNNYTQNAWVTVLGNTGGLSRTGYSFAGWTTNAAGSGTTYAAGDKYTMGTASVTFYAKWTGNNVTVTYDSKGGTVSPTSQTKVVGSTYGSPEAIPTPTKAGYTFGGWWTGDGSGTQVTNSTIVTNPSNHTLYAKWTGNNVTVTYDPKGGTVSPTSQTKVIGSTYGSPDAMPIATKDGNTFGGWWTGDGSGTQVTDTTTVTNPANHTLYAQWELIPPPAVPTGLTATAGDSEVALKWNANSENNLKGYNVEYKPASASNWNSTYVTSNSCTISGLTNGVEYIFKVNAVNNSNIASSYSSEVRATPAASTVAVTGVELDKGSCVLNIGDMLQLTATVDPAAASNKNVSWTSDETSVATVSSTGLVTALGVGTANIKVTTEDGGYEAVCAVTVKKAVPLPAVTLSNTVLFNTSDSNYVIMGILATFSNLTGNTIIDKGFISLKNPGSDPGTSLTLDTPGIFAISAPVTDSQGRVVRAIKTEYGNIFYVRAYVKYTDQLTGATTVIYSNNVVKAVKNK